MIFIFFLLCLIFFFTIVLPAVAWAFEREAPLTVQVIKRVTRRTKRRLRALWRARVKSWEQS